MSIKCVKKETCTRCTCKEKENYISLDELLANGHDTTPFYRR